MLFPVDRAPECVGELQRSNESAVGSARVAHPFDSRRGFHSVESCSRSRSENSSSDDQQLTVYRLPYGLTEPCIGAEGIASSRRKPGNLTLTPSLEGRNNRAERIVRPEWADSSGMSICVPFSTAWLFFQEAQSNLLERGGSRRRHHCMRRGRRCSRVR